MTALASERPVWISVRWPDIGWRFHPLAPEPEAEADADALTPEARYLTAELRNALGEQAEERG